jgi:hypothetical protein
MIFDQENLFSDRQSVVGSNGATINSTNTIDLGEATFNRDVGLANVPLRVQVVEDVAGSGSSLTVEVETSNAENFSSSAVIATTPAVPVASLKAGYVFPELQLPIGSTRRYVRLRYKITGAATTAGKVTAGVVHGHDFSRYRAL